MNKKIISLVLALVMVLGTFTSVFAEAAPKADAKKTEETKKTEVKKAEAGEKVEKVVGKDNKIQYVIDKKLVEGYEDGTYGLDKNIKRSEITRLLVLANGNEALAKQLQGSMKIYSDVDAKHWANGVISVGTTVPSDANGIAMLAGYPDGSFKPENDVTYAELAKMLVVLAKKDLTADMVKNAVWATSWMTWAAQLGILDDVNVVDSNKAANRADAFTMIYNALYTMKEFKRVPANETRGIISNLTKDVLTLNQDSKMEYKVTGETVFVTGTNAARQQIVKLNELNLKTDDYYLGSLVRILVNDKNEVTHIIELGNPADLAKNNAPARVSEDNSVWRGVADNTVETREVTKATAKYASNDNQLVANTDAYATIGFKKANNVDANKITFHNIANAKNADKTVALKINDKTEIYVANPGNNQMRKVANINEALGLLGYKNYDNYRIVDVYAGYDTDGLDRNYKAIKYDTADRNTAKVIVFNLVNKEAEGEKYRIIESSSSRFVTTIEKADGTLIERNNMKDTSRFPLEYGDKLDVVELDDVRTGSIYKTLIDHSSSDFPIVKVTKVDSDKKYIEIEDLRGEKSFLDIRDADIFSAKRYGKLEEGTSIQFRVENHAKDNANNVAEVISLLGDAKLRDSIKGILPSADKAQRVGRLVEVKSVNGVWHMVVRVDYNLFDEADKDGYATYIVADQYVDGLKKLVDKKIAFKVFERNNNGLFFATDIRENNDAQTPVEETKDALTKYRDLVNGLPAATEVTVENYKKALEDANKAIEVFNYDMTKSQQGEVTNRQKTKVKDVKTAAQAIADEKTAFEGFETAVKALNNTKVKVQQAENTDPAKIKAALVTTINALGQRGNNKAVTADDVTLPTDLTQPIKVKVVLKSEKENFKNNEVKLTITLDEQK